MQWEPGRYTSELVGTAPSELRNEKFMKRRYWERLGLLHGCEISWFGDLAALNAKSWFYSNFERIWRNQRTCMATCRLLERKRRRGRKERKRKNCFPDVTLFGRYTFPLHFSLAGDAISADKSTHFDHAMACGRGHCSAPPNLQKKVSRCFLDVKNSLDSDFGGPETPRASCNGLLSVFANDD